MRRALVLLALTLAVGPLPTASACGGFFCSSSPVEQSREVIVYGYEDDGTLTMAVQVRYEGTDEQFAWILPVPVPPDEIGVGADVLFDALYEATTPVFNTEAATEGTCRTDPECTYPSYSRGCDFGCVQHSAPLDRSSSADASLDGMAPTGVTVYSESIVGPYDTIVLGATTAAEAVDWLRTNEYDVPLESEPLLEPYAAQGHVFVALRLTANRSSDVLRPIVLRMPTDEACLPIRLTAIATTPALPIQAIFLGDAQVRATNFSTADVELVPELFQGTLGWDAAVRARVQELGGQAFATDYAGATPSVTIALPDVVDLASVSDPGEFLRTLADRGYGPSALLLDLLERHLSPPSGQPTQAYYNCLFRGSTDLCGQPSRFDPEGLASGIEAEITAPRRDAQALVDRHPYLTRLSTTLRAEDMTIDPVFARDSALEDVPRARVATLVTECGPDYYVSRAPQRLDIGGASYRVSEGVETTPDELCRSRGGTLASSGGCSSSSGLPAPGALVLLALGAAVLWRAHRRAQRR